MLNILLVGQVIPVSRPHGVCLSEADLFKSSRSVRRAVAKTAATATKQDDDEVAVHNVVSLITCSLIDNIGYLCDLFIR